ncbi:MAG: hypothetical protein H6706_21670 [Myxococcales bacterium]|nr:hypothetical protein [Myxococcales bacterium]
MRKSLILLLLSVAGGGCGQRDADPAAAAPSSSTPELRAAWRDSVKYRSAHQALVSNLESLKADEQRLDRELTEAKVLVRIPVASLEAADAGEATAYLKLYADRLGLGRMDELRLKTEPAPAPPPVEVEAAQGIHYDDAQVVGVHRMVIEFPSMADAERFVRGLGELERPLALDALEPVGEGCRLTGHFPFFRDLQPMRVVADAKDVDGLLKSLGMAGATGEAGEVVAKLKANYAEVAGLGAPLVEAYQVEARLKLKATRMAIFKRHAQALQASTWEALKKP